MATYLRGIDLRYFLTLHLINFGPKSIAELIDAVHESGFAVSGRPSKTVSDALRWERRRGRIVRQDRGNYRAREVPRTTERRIHTRVMELRATNRESESLDAFFAAAHGFGTDHL